MKRGRPAGADKAAMAGKRDKAMRLIEANPTLSMARIARHVGVSEPTVQNWFKKAHLVRWF
jgi:DNA-binding Lrp family transcriptional regulator